MDNVLIFQKEENWLFKSRPRSERTEFFHLSYLTMCFKFDKKESKLQFRLRSKRRGKIHESRIECNHLKRRHSLVKESV